MTDTMGQWEIAIRLAAATVTGALTGAHFELRDRPGGLRTHILTTLAAALFCITAGRLAGGSAAEVARMMQGVASGVGFIGGAAVLRRGSQVEGVSNAASLWIAAAIGCEAGAGDPRAALGIAVFVAMLVVAAYHSERRWLRRHRSRNAASKDDASRPG